MKYLFIVIVSFTAFVRLHAQDDLSSFLSDTDKFLKKYVQSGDINYQALSKNNADLKPLVSFIAQASLENLSDLEKEAFYINAYNILVINQVIENYPINSPQAIGGFFDIKKHQVSNERITLNTLEKEKLLAATQDPRLHFVLVCAAKGCPKIANFAYLPDQLEAQVEERTRLALNDPEFIRVNESAKKAELSEIFTWYKQDFQKNGNTVLDFINQYRTQKLDDYQIGSYTYDWTLNSLGGDKQVLNSTDQKSNIQVFTPSALFRKGQFEVNVFNNLYTQTQVRDGAGEEVGLGQRQTFVNTMIQFTYGVSKSARVNLGFDVYVSSASVDNDCWICL